MDRNRANIKKFAKIGLARYSKSLNIKECKDNLYMVDVKTFDYSRKMKITPSDNISKYKGNIYEVVDNKASLKSKSFGYIDTIEIELEDFEHEINNHNTGEYYIFDEGVMVYIFSVNKKMYFSINGHINIDDKDVGRYFDDALDNIKINRNYFKDHINMINEITNKLCHTFILIHPKNQLLNTNEVIPNIKHLGTWDVTNKKVKFVNYNFNKITKPSYVSREIAIDRFKNEDIIVYISKGKLVKYITSNKKKLYTIISKKNPIKSWYFNVKLRPYIENNVSIFIKEQIDIIKDNMEGNIIKAAKLGTELYRKKYFGKAFIPIYHNKFIEKNIILPVNLKELNNKCYISYKKSRIKHSNSKNIHKFCWGLNNSNKNTDRLSIVDKKIFNVMLNNIKELKGLILYDFFREVENFYSTNNYLINPKIL